MYTLKRSENPKKKYSFEILENGNVKKINFGANGYSDFTINKDPERK